jgi:hypothetical protein
MLFLLALLAAGVLLAFVVTALEGTAFSGPWLAPLSAGVCQVVALFLGRRFILPPHSLASPVRTAISLTTTVVGTMVIAAGAVWTVERTIGWILATPALSLVLWFVLLWLAIGRQNWQTRLKTDIR